MEQYLRPELVMGLLAVAAIGLQIAVNARALFSVRRDREPLPRGEYDLHRAARDEQVAELRSRVQSTEAALHRRVDEAVSRLDGLLEALHELRVEMAGLTAGIRAAGPNLPKGETQCRPLPNPATRRPSSG